MYIACHEDWFKNHAAISDKHRFCKHTKYTMGELLTNHEKDKHNEQLQKDVSTFLSDLPSDIRAIPELKAAFETNPQTINTLNRDVVDLIQQFLIKHTTALGITPFGLQHSSTKVLVSVCPSLPHIIYIFFRYCTN